LIILQIDCDISDLSEYEMLGQHSTSCTPIADIPDVAPEVIDQPVGPMLVPIVKSRRRELHIRRNKSSRYKGVAYTPFLNKKQWRCEIVMPLKRVRTSHYKEEEAALAFNQLVVERDGMEAIINDLDEPGKLIDLSTLTPWARNDMMTRFVCPEDKTDVRIQTAENQLAMCWICQGTKFGLCVECNDHPVLDCWQCSGKICTCHQVMKFIES
jgi:hypothetical protein